MLITITLKGGEDIMTKVNQTVTCPICGRQTRIRLFEFTLTYCEHCGSTYGCKCHDAELKIYTVTEHHTEESDW